MYNCSKWTERGSQFDQKRPSRLVQNSNSLHTFWILNAQLYSWHCSHRKGCGPLLYAPFLRVKVKRKESGPLLSPDFRFVGKLTMRVTVRKDHMGYKWERPLVEGRVYHTLSSSQINFQLDHLDNEKLQKCQVKTSTDQSPRSALNRCIGELRNYITGQPIATRTEWGITPSSWHLRRLTVGTERMGDPVSDSGISNLCEKLFLVLVCDCWTPSPFGVLVCWTDLDLLVLDAQREPEPLVNDA